MECHAAMQNDVVLRTIFSYLDFNNLKQVRLVDNKWNSLSEKQFVNKSLVSIALGLNYSENLTKTTIVPYITLRGYLQAQHRSLPMWEVEMGQAFGDEVSDYFQKFKHFKVHYVGAWRASEQYAIQRETSLKHLAQLIEIMRRPDGSLRINFEFGKTDNEQRYGDGAAMVTSAINNCSNVTMGLKMRSCFNDDYYEPEPELVLDAFPPETKFSTCTSIEINSAQVEDTVLFFTNLQKLQFTSRCYRDVFPTVMDRIVQNLDQFDKLTDIRCEKSVLLENIGSLKKLSTPLKHLHLRIRCNFYSGIDDGYAELEEILAKHSLTLESLQLSFKWKINFDDDDEDYDEGVNLGKIRTLSVARNAGHFRTAGNFRGANLKVFLHNLFQIFAIFDFQEGRFYTKFPSLQFLKLHHAVTPGCSIQGNIFNDEAVTRFQNYGIVSISQTNFVFAEECTTDDENDY
ncbi:uncharacterized protein LOC110862753 isoform X2 [Folsomia candida]|uniref:uncharacterized protein LOC110862753 isoform X2 n=1 Tax=Folsomia candida TaxID=158441 RepID=UPI0016053470|nr:uncharacterized protein LOC110862753 isoform X2 [Folsomia candida]